MADKYKGITLTINGDSTPLQKALKEPQAEARTLEGNLKKVNQMLKLDPKNTELLAQKQHLLGEAVEKNKEKLNLLKQAQQEFIDSGGDINSTEYINLQQEIKRTEQNLASLESQQNSFNQTCQQMGESLQNAGENLINAGEKIDVVGSKIREFGKEAIEVTGDFDEAMQKVKAISGATGDDFDRLREKAQKLGRTTQYSASESADALGYMAMAGWNTEQMLGGIDGVLSMAAASGIDLATSASICTSTISAFGLTAEDAGQVADVLAVASSNAKTDVQGLGEAFKNVAPVAGALGYSVEDTSILLGLMANSSIEASSAGNQLKSMFSRLAKPTKEVSQAMDDLNLSITDSSGQMLPLEELTQNLRTAFADLTEEQKAQYASIIAGKTGMAGLLAIVTASSESYEKLNKNVKNAAGVSSEMASIMQDSLNGQLTALKSGIEGLQIAIGNILMPLIRGVVEIIQNVVNWLLNLDDNTKKIITVIGSIIAVLGPILIVGGKLMVGLGRFITYLPVIKNAITGLTTTMSGLWSSMLANPIIWIIGIIALLVAAFIHLWNTNDEFRQSMTDTWNTLKQAFQEFAQGITDRLGELGISWSDVINALMTYWQMLCDYLAPIFEGTWTVIVDVLRGFFDIILGVIDFFTGLFTGNWDKCWQGIKTILAGILQIILGAVKGWIIQIQGTFENIANWLGFKWSDIWNNVKNGFNSFVEWFQNGLNNFISFFTETIPNALNWFINHLTEIIGFFIALLINPKRAVENLFKIHFPGQLEAFKKFFDQKCKEFEKWVKEDVPNFFKNLWNQIKNFFTELPGNIWNWLKQVYNNIENWGKSTQQNIENWVSSLFNTIQSFFTALPHKAYTWGTDMIQGFIDGIQNMIGGVIDKVEEVAGWVSKYLHFSVPDEGPLSDFDKSGEDMVDLFIQGMEKKKTALERAVQGVAQTLAGAQDFNQTIAQTNNQTINIPVSLNLDGKTITKNVIQRITRDSRSLRLSKGVA